jgi:hypothetical protein
MTRRRKAWTLSTVACVVGLVSCAQTTVRPAMEPQGAGLPRPERIIVFDPAVTPAEVSAQPGLGPSAVAAGAVTAAGVAANAVGHGIHAYRPEVNAEAGRTAAQAVAYLSEFFAKEGWIAPDQVQKVKRAPD